MLRKTVVPDANVFVKLFSSESDINEARMFFKICARTDTKLFVPELFKYEIARITQYFKESLEKTLDIFESHERSILKVVSPDRETWLLAEEIVISGHEKSGFPSMYDSIYHAMAIRMDSIFLTADRKHYVKAKQFGHIKMLEEWESVFIDA